MIITPYKYNFLQKPNASAPITQLSYNLKPLKSDVVEISFQCNDDNFETQGLASFNLADYKNINGIHCPCCGTKMLSEEEFSNILKDAAEIDNGDDFLKLLNRYSDFIPNNMRSILSVDTEHDNMHVFFQNARRQSFRRHEQSIIFAKQKFFDFAETIEDEALKQELLNAVRSITNKDSKTVFKTKIADVMPKLNLSREQNQELHGSYNELISATSHYSSIFRANFMHKQMSDTEISKELANRIFSCSLQDFSQLSKLDKNKDKYNNQVLICKKCNSRASKTSFLTTQPALQSNLKENLKLYISDIAFLMGKGDIQKNFSYIPYFLFVSNKASFDTVKFDDYFVNRLSSLMNVASHHREFEPLMQEDVDIPCASCETILMPHSVKVKFEQDLSKCNSLIDYSNVLKKYEKYIGDVSRDLADEFFNIVEENPNIDDDEFAETLRYRMIPYYTKNFYEIMDNLVVIRDYFEDAGNPKFTEMIDEVNSRIWDYVDKGKFDDFEFYKLNEACLSDLMNDETPSLLRGVVTRIKLLSYMSFLSKTDDRNATSDKDKFYTIVYNIIKPSIATVSLLDPQVEGFDNDFNNFIGLCKPCNSISKSKSSVHHWYKRVLGVRKHFYKQLEVIDNMAKEGKLPGFENWASKIADVMYEKTYGKYDIRNRFKLPEE